MPSRADVVYIVDLAIYSTDEPHHLLEIKEQVRVVVKRKTTKDPYELVRAKARRAFSKVTCPKGSGQSVAWDVHLAQDTGLKYLVCPKPQKHLPDIIIQ